jgi:hypothetical protein
MTPAERKAKIAAAEALLNSVAADEDASLTTPVIPAVTTIAQAQAQVAASVKPLVAPLTFQNKTLNPSLAAVTGPGGDTRQSGQPSLLQTMKTVWANMKAKK